MCGIACIYGPHTEKVNILQKSLEKVIHRGSEIFEYKLFDNICLGANRLPIQGRDNGQQPASNEDKTIFAIQNGEIFNYQEKKSELKEKGHTFTTNCDTELLCHLYEEYHTEMIQHIDSEMFAFVIYDKKNNRIYAARDPIGVKPLFYAYHADGSIHFASEMKQLAQFDDITQIHIFPKAHYYYDGTFINYQEFAPYTEYFTFGEAKRKLTHLITEAIKKRVQTDLPIGVFFSGGVDSSLVMDIAHKFHPDVTALIVGQEGSSDYEAALELCKAYHYKYKTISSHTPSLKEIADIAYYTETYEPNVNRVSIANDFASTLAKQLGLSVILCGEGADELFAGYNEFAALDTDEVNHGSRLLVNGLEKGQLLRVDRLGMKHTIEVRCPFLDTEIVKLALSIPGRYKVHKNNHNIITKHILREIAIQFVPRYIAYRYKVPFNVGSGINVGYNYKKDQWNKKAFISLYKENTLTQQEVLSHDLETLEEQRNFSIYKSYGYNKLTNDEQRIIVKDNLKTLNRGQQISFLVAEFGFIPLYFPLYFAQEVGIFKEHGLYVEFISTKGDDKTHRTICNNSADIGVADPLFSMTHGGTGITSKVFGQLINGLPIKAVCFDPSIKIKEINDFRKYKIGSYQQYSTTHTFSCLICQHSVIPLVNDLKEISEQLRKKVIDIAFVLWEDANELEKLGGHILYDFYEPNDEFLYTGFTTTNLINEEQEAKLEDFLISIELSIQKIQENPEYAITIAQKLFPRQTTITKTIKDYMKIRGNVSKLNKNAALQAYKMRKSIYPDLMTEFNESFFEK